jgi:hypothetical protein
MPDVRPVHGTTTKDSEQASDAPSEAVSFLKQLRPNGPWVLTAIATDGLINTTTTRTAADVDAFVREHNGKRNLYYSVNPTRGTVFKKTAKTDIAAIEYLLADLDPNVGEHTTGRQGASVVRFERSLGLAYYTHGLVPVVLHTACCASNNFRGRVSAGYSL